MHLMKTNTLFTTKTQVINDDKQHKTNYNTYMIIKILRRHLSYHAKS